MTISSTVNRTSTAGDGIVTAFSFPYLFFADDDLKVIVVVDSTGVETTQTITTHYTVAGAGEAAGGTVTMVTPPASGETLVIIREEQLTQGLDLVENDPFPSDLVEQSLDSLTMIAQQLGDKIDRSVTLSDGDSTGVDLTLPTPVALKTFRWNAGLTALEEADDPTTAATAAAASAAAALVSENAAAADLVLTNADVVLTNADVVLTNADVVLTNADVVSSGVSETNAAASASAAAASAAGIFWKEPVLCATTANITLSGEQTLDSATTTSASRVLVKDQTASEENGIYVTATGAWARATPLDTWDEHISAAVIVSEGTAHGDSAWICTVDQGGTLETTAITWANLSQVYVTATTTSEGIIETSTDAEMLTGTATDKAVTPSNATYLRTQDTSYTGDQTFGPITETQTTKATSFTPSLTAEGTVYNCNAAITITMPSAEAGKGFTIIHDDGTEITWAGTILWAGGAAPTAAAAVEIYVFLSDGTNWYGNLAGTGFA